MTVWGLMNELIGCDVCNYGKPTKDSPCLDALRNKGAWTEGFYQCPECAQVYIKGWDRDWEEVTKSPVSSTIIPALNKDASVETVWPYLQFNSRIIPASLYVSHGEFEPQLLFDLVTNELCHAETSDSEKYYYLDIINQLFDLGSYKFREQLKKQEWLVKLNNNNLLEEIQNLAHKLSTEKSHSSKYQESLIKFRAEAFGRLEEPGKLKVNAEARQKFILNFPIKDNSYSVSNELERNPPQITHYKNIEDPDKPKKLEVDIFLLIKNSFKYLSPYHNFLLPIVISAVLIDVLAEASAEQTMGLSYLFFGGTCSVIYAGIVSINAGRWPNNSAWKIIRERNSCLTDFIFLGFIIILCSGIMYGILSSYITITDKTEDVYMISLLILMILISLTKFWPSIVLAFTFRGESQWSLTSGANVWRGPGLSDAWHITGLKGVFFKLSLPWVGMVCLAISINYLIELWLGTFFRIIFLYAITLPIIYSISFEFLNKIISTFGVMDELEIMRKLWEKS